MSGLRTGAVEAVARALEYLGVISVDRFHPTIGLAWPRIVTGFSIMSKQTADLAMVGAAVGTSGTAGLAFALAYWDIVVMIGLGVAGGTITLISQNFGGGDTDRASLAIKQSVLVTVALAVSIMTAFLVFAGSLIGLLGAGPESLGHGTVYLVLVTPAILFEMLNLVASRTYTGVGDTFTEMTVRAGGAVLNIVISGVLIFGFGMDVAGAAIGTTASTGCVTLVFAWGMFGRSYGVVGMQPSPVPLTLSRPWFDRQLARQLIEISIPEIGRRLAEGIVVIPLLWIAASFGPVIVTALEVGRRVRALINSVNWGLSIASSSLVGQQLGAGNEAEAGAYGASIVRLSVVLFVGLASLVVVFAEPIATLFVSGPTEVDRAAWFVVAGAISSIGFGLDGAAAGALLGAGDTRWPFVASLVGRYAFAVPVAVLGLVTPLGIGGLFLALLIESFVPGGINYWLFRSGRWKVVSRKYRPSSG